MRVKFGWPVAAVSPPSTTIAAPGDVGGVVRGEEGDDRGHLFGAADAAHRDPLAVLARRSSAFASSGPASGVSIGPGQTAFTRMPSRAWSIASVRV